MNFSHEYAGLEFSRVYTLQASSPLIHFQHSEPGATLRATEAKPKLDRFLNRKAKNEIKDLWKIGDTDALNYKMRIESQTAEVVDIGYKTDYPNYYGDKTKKGVISDSVLVVICFIPELLALIDKYIAEFFATTNFGTMSGKGFGSFFVKEKAMSTSEIAKALKEKSGARECYYFTTFKPFRSIDILYKKMKSGLNGKGQSLLFSFAEKYGLANDKEWLVNTGIAPTGKAGEIPYDYEYAFVRALLGLASHFSYRKNGDVKIKDVETQNDKIVERLPSPIFFKVRKMPNKQYEVFVVANRINEEIYGKSFRFSRGKQSDELDVPTVEQLGDDFIDEFMKYVSLQVNPQKDFGISLKPVR